MRRIIKNARLRLMAAACGGGALVLSGCDPTVRDTVLSGVEGAATTLFGTFVSAFFESLEPTEEVPTTVMKMVVEHDLFA